LLGRFHEDPFSRQRSLVVATVQPLPAGGVGLVGCTFRRCDFHRVSFMGIAEHVAEWDRAAAHIL
jgi:hypothetical protein